MCPQIPTIDFWWNHRCHRPEKVVIFLLLISFCRSSPKPLLLRRFRSPPEGIQVFSRLFLGVNFDSLELQVRASKLRGIFYPRRNFFLQFTRNLQKNFPNADLSPVARAVKVHEVTKWPEYPPEKVPTEETQNDAGKKNVAAETFTFHQLASATKNFKPECLLGEGGFGRVYKGLLEKTGQVIAVKQLDRNGFQGNQEFLVEVLILSLLHHENLVKLIGYCADGDQRLLVYEYMPNGSLEDHLLDISADQNPLSWYARMKIAHGAAQGLEYLHEKANPPVIYRDLKSSNILLNENFVAKLSDFGLAKLSSIGDKIQVSSAVMSTYGYCAPEYVRAGQLTLKSDVYSFGVVMLELITGRRAIDTTRPTDEQNLVAWAMPLLKDQKRFPELVDPLLQGDYPAKGLGQAAAVAAMCLQEEPSVRPLMTDVVVALSFLTTE